MRVLRTLAALEQFPRDYGGYRLTGLLGSGGSADVYRAEIPTGGRVAIRRLARVQSDRVAQQILLEEARVWVALRHPNIVSVIDIGQHEGDWFLVLELVDGAAADQVVHATGPLSVPEALTVIERVSRALSYAHRLSMLGKTVEVVHRDVKPANILLSLDGKVKLTDFGIARTNDRLGQTKAGIVRGSLHYMAPEQVKRQPLDNRTDLFALGCTLHALLTGRPLISGPKEQVIRILQQGNIPDPPEEMPEEIRALMRDLTAADPDRRLPSADDVAEAARELLSPRSPDDVERDLSRRILDVRERFSDSGTSELAPDSPIGAVGTRTILSDHTEARERDRTHTSHTRTRVADTTSDVDLTLDSGPIPEGAEGEPTNRTPRDQISKKPK